MTDQPPSRRLDSWKEIGAYLNRDERTARRWERTLGLPVKRLGRSRGASVFAFTHDIDEWLKTVDVTGAAAIAHEAAAGGTSLPAQRQWLRPRLVAAIVIVAAGLVTWRVAAQHAAPTSIRFSPAGITAAAASGAQVWRVPFATDERALVPFGRNDNVEMWPDGRALVGIAHRVHEPDEALLGGQLYWISRQGRVDRITAFDDTFTFGGGVFTGPWVVSDFRAIDDNDGARRIAVAVRHMHWSPGFVDVLDDGGRVRGRFVNAGWVEQVRWLSPQRILAAGFSNAMDGGMLALLDARALSGQSPTTSNPEFRCADCGDAGPLKYVVLPRSEVNRAAGAPFNRAVVNVVDGRVVVHTIESPGNETTGAEVIYTFTPDLSVIAGSFGERYWDLHRVLELQGVIHHDRAHCPDRNGPGEIHTWDSARGWQTVRVR